MNTAGEAMEIHLMSEKELDLTDRDSQASGTEDLLRALLIQLEEQNLDTALEGQAGDAVLLDVELDGSRYVLLRSPVAPISARSSLSPREQEIARMVADGYPNKTIAAVLEISSWTVDTHLRRIFAKLGVRTRSAMVAQLLKEGLIKIHSADMSSRART